MSELTKNIKACPVKTAMKYLGKRWTIEIIRDLMFANRRYSEFLELNSGLSSKVLAERLKELESGRIIYKKIVSKTPLKIEYELTEKGWKLNRILYELALFSFEFYKEEVLENPNIDKNDMKVLSLRMFNLEPEQVQVSSKS